MRRVAPFILLGALVLLVGCSKKKHTPKVPFAPSPGWTETGIASWYGHPYHGRRAANGEIYDMEKLTAAHRTLPFGANVRVTNLTNNRQVEVRITDRGPFIDGRIIDLSHAAAGQVELIGPGVAKVRIQLLSYGPARIPDSSAPPQIGPPPPPVVGPAQPAPAVAVAAFAVQVGAFVDRARAERLRDELLRTYSPVELVRRDGAQTQWRVLVGNKPTEEEAQLLADELRPRTGAALVVRLDPPAKTH